MNILFLTLLDFNSIEEKNIYTDLLKEFFDSNHKVFIISPIEKSRKIKSNIIKNNNLWILKPVIGNIQKINVFEKIISTLSIGLIFKNFIKKHLNKIKFDLILYSTPPITFVNSIKYIKNRDQAKTYLLLKDIFPQNAVDLHMFSKKNIIYKYFRYQEKRLYKISDYIGCMSKGNVDYIRKYNKYINPEKVEVCPNSIKIENKKLIYSSKKEIFDKYNIPKDKIICIYGGNLGKPQGVDYLIKCIKDINIIDFYFLIIGSGTEYKKVQAFEKKYKEKVKLIKYLPKDEYENILAYSDVGLIFLNYKFTIPNFPSRLLSYMKYSLPILAATDTTTDLKDIIIDYQLGLWNESIDTKQFINNLKILKDNNLRSKFGGNAYNYLLNNYTSKQSYNIIMKHFKE